MACDQILRNRIYAARTPELDTKCTGELPMTILSSGLVFEGEVCNKSQRADETGSGRCNICPLRLIANFTQNTSQNSRRQFTFQFKWRELHGYQFRLNSRSGQYLVTCRNIAYPEICIRRVATAILVVYSVFQHTVR